MNWDTALCTAAGGRPVNQDAVAWLSAPGDEAGCWALADGLGGHGGGERASRLAVETAMRAFAAGPSADPAAVLRMVHAAHEAIRAAQQSEPALASMRTTLLLLVIGGARAMWAHVGDSRLYRFPGGRGQACTRDHSFAQALVDAGRLPAADLRFHEDRSRLLRSLGGPNCEVDTGESAADCDAWLLASDGFWEPLTETEMEVELAKSATAASWLAGMQRRIAARRLPDRDNASAIAIRKVSRPEE